MAEYIVRDGETGQALVSSTGTPVEDILDAIDTTGSVDGALRRFPGLTIEGVSAALQFARLASRREMTYQSTSNYGYMELRERPLTEFNAGGAATLEPERRAGSGSVEGSLRAADARREQLLYELDVVESIRDGLQDVLDGNVISHEEVMAHMRARFPG